MGYRNYAKSPQRDSRHLGSRVPPKIIHPHDTLMVMILTGVLKMPTCQATSSPHTISIYFMRFPSTHGHHSHHWLQPSSHPGGSEAFHP